jgi:hypothetical protein
MNLVDKVVALHGSLDSANIAHAFGGALALAYCTGDPRGTSDIDLNIFVPSADPSTLFAALPLRCTWSDSDQRHVQRDGQVRIFWDDTPLDLFFIDHPFHDQVATRTRTVTFSTTTIPVLSCADLAVFKAFFDRPKDWVDISEMLLTDSFDVPVVQQQLGELLGPDDSRIERVARPFG